MNDTLNSALRENASSTGKYQKLNKNGQNYVFQEEKLQNNIQTTNVTSVI